MAVYTTDRRIRVVLQILLDEIEEKISVIERRQAIDTQNGIGSLSANL